MKLIARTFNDDGSGQVTLKPEEAEDMWHLYHLIAREDQVMATTIRKVQKESSSGLVNTERIKLTLTIAVDKVHFDPMAGTLRIAGKNVTDNKFIKVCASNFCNTNTILYLFILLLFIAKKRLCY